VYLSPKEAGFNWEMLVIKGSSYVYTVTTDVIDESGKNSYKYQGQVNTALQGSIVLFPLGGEQKLQWYVFQENDYMILFKQTNELVAWQQRGEIPYYNVLVKVGPPDHLLSGLRNPSIESIFSNLTESVK